MAIAAPLRGKSRREEDLYPSSDGKPVGETDKHIDLLLYCREALKAHFADRAEEVYISGNNFIYYEEGNPKAVVSPDGYVVFGVPMRQRDSYRTWKEGGRLPSVVFEFTSKKTKREDTRVKRPLYETILRVPEYFIFDPTGDYLKQRLQGFRMVGDRYVTLEVVENRLHSEQLGLDLVQDDTRLRLYDPARQEWLLSSEELALRAAEEARRADAMSRFAETEMRRAEAAEAEIARLKAELEALRRQQE